MDITGYMIREIDMGGGNEVEDGMDGMDKSFFAYKNHYGEGYWIDERAAELAAMKTMYFTDAKYIGTTEERGRQYLMTQTDDPKASIKVTVDKKGVLKLSGKTFNGFSVSSSTTLLPEIDGSLTGWLPITMKKNAKFQAETSFLFHFNYDGSTISLDMYYIGPAG